MYGKDFGYASTRILNTIVRLANGDPVYVMHMSLEGMCYVCPLEKEWVIENCKQYDLDDLDLHPVPLGYVNSSGVATYLQRMPLRRDWKQGLRQENCSSSNRRLYSLPMDAVKKCIIGDYPTFKRAYTDARKRSENTLKAIAWHRHWAVTSVGSIFYKNELVGETINDQPTLNDKYKYLKEYLSETL